MPAFLGEKEKGMVREREIKSSERGRDKERKRLGQQRTEKIEKGTKAGKQEER